MSQSDILFVFNGYYLFLLYIFYLTFSFCTSYGIGQSNAIGIKDYKNSLQPYYEKINQKEPLTPDEVESATKIVNNYYTDLVNKGIAYGQLARDVVNNHGAFAEIANNHLVNRAKVEGFSDAQIENIKNNIRVALAYSDMDLRSKNEKNNAFLPYNSIAKYHYDVFERQGLSKYAWGGTLFEEFAGSGSWMDLGGYDTSVDVKQMDLVKAIAFNEKSNGVTALEALKSIKNLPLNELGNSLSVLTTRSLISYEPINKILQNRRNNFYTSGGHLFDYEKYKTHVLDGLRKNELKPNCNLEETKKSNFSLTDYSKRCLV